MLRCRIPTPVPGIGTGAPLPDAPLPDPYTGARYKDRCSVAGYPDAPKKKRDCPIGTTPLLSCTEIPD